MVDIGTSEKITNLWPAPPTRAIEKTAQKRKSLKQQQRNKKNKSESEQEEDGPGKNIDEFV